MNSGLTSHQQRGHTETGPRFKVSSERPEKRGVKLDSKDSDQPTHLHCLVNIFFLAQ